MTKIKYDAGMCNRRDFLIDYCIDYAIDYVIVIVIGRKNSLADRNRNCNRVEKISRLLR